MGSQLKDQLKTLMGWLLPGAAGLSSVWTPNVIAALAGESTDQPFEPITFANTLNQDTNNLYAAHRSHSSHSSHRSHSSHYSSSGGGYVAPSSPSPSPASPPTSSTEGRAQTKSRINPEDPGLVTLIMRVQAALLKKGIDPGAISGKLEPETINALRKYQTENHLGVTGTMTTETLTSLGVQLP